MNGKTIHLQYNFFPVTNITIPNIYQHSVCQTWSEF